MVPDMLLLRADEVARNGAFGKILRPEVFPDAPLQLRLSPKYTPLGFPALPQKVLPNEDSQGNGRSAVLFSLLEDSHP
jgi:hypothetical protein